MLARVMVPTGLPTGGPHPPPSGDWTLTAETWGPPVDGHPMLAALVGIGGYAGTEALTVTTPTAPTRVRQAV